MKSDLNDKTRRAVSAEMPKHINRVHVLKAISDLDAGVRHGFGESRKYALVFQGKLYPPKAVLGRAMFHLHSRQVSPKSFSGGETTNTLLRRLGFEIVQKKVKLLTRT